MQRSKNFLKSTLIELTKKLSLYCKSVKAAATREICVLNMYSHIDNFVRSKLEYIVHISQQNAHS